MRKWEGTDMSVFVSKANNWWGAGSEKVKN